MVKVTTPSGSTGGAAQAGDFHGLPVPKGEEFDLLLLWAEGKK